MSPWTAFDKALDRRFGREGHFDAAGWLSYPFLVVLAPVAFGFGEISNWNFTGPR